MAQREGVLERASVCVEELGTSVGHQGLTIAHFLPIALS